MKPLILIILLCGFGCSPTPLPPRHPHIVITPTYTHETTGQTADDILPDWTESSTTSKNSVLTSSNLKDDF